MLKRLSSPTSIRGLGPRLARLAMTTKIYRCARLQMREIMRERGDFFFAQGIGDLRHRRHAAPRSHARLVVAQRLEQVILALAGETGHRFRSRIGIGVA